MTERIKQALDLARTQRLAATGTTPAPPVPPEAAPQPPIGTPFRVVVSQLEEHRLLTPDAGHEVVQAYKVLRTQVLQRMNEHGWRTLAVVSPGPNDGKTLTALNLAMSLVADLRQSALVVEFDLRQPSIAERFGLPPLQVGVEDVLANGAPLADATFRIEGIEGIEGLSLLLARHAVRDSSELLASTQTAELVAILKAADPQRIVLFDLPPVLAYDDALRFAPLADAVLVVVAEGVTRRADVRRVIDLFPKMPVIGTVLNNSRELSQGYYY